MQKETLGINNFLNIANTYSENVFPDININKINIIYKINSLKKILEQSLISLLKFLQIIY